MCPTFSSIFNLCRICWVLTSTSLSLLRHWVFRHICDTGTSVTHVALGFPPRGRLGWRTFRRLLSIRPLFRFVFFTALPSLLGHLLPNRNYRAEGYGSVHPVWWGSLVTCKNCRSFWNSLLVCCLKGNIRLVSKKRCPFLDVSLWTVIWSFALFERSISVITNCLSAFHIWLDSVYVVNLMNLIF